MDREAKPTFDHRPLTATEVSAEEVRLRNGRRNCVLRGSTLLGFILTCCVTGHPIGAVIVLACTPVLAAYEIFSENGFLGLTYAREALEIPNDLQSLEPLVKRAERNQEVADAWRDWVGHGLVVRQRDVKAARDFCDELYDWRRYHDIEARAKAITGQDPLSPA